MLQTRPDRLRLDRAARHVVLPPRLIPDRTISAQFRRERGPGIGYAAIHMRFVAPGPISLLPGKLCTMHRLRGCLSPAFVLLIGVTAAAADRPPNIVIILADDFGVGDIQAHYPDNRIPTPHLDRLVRQGTSFTDAHSPSAVCSPTRYGLLTGRYAWRTRLQEWVIAAYEPPLISRDRPTIASFLRQHGYHTACIGKWHLGWEWPGPQQGKMTEVRNGQKSLEWDFTRPIPGGPTDRGFDFYFGVDLPNLPPFTWISGDRIVDQPTEKYRHDPGEGFYMPRSFEGAPIAPGWKFDQILPTITHRAAEHVTERAGKNKPFLLYFSLTSPHEPIVPSRAFRGRSGIAPIADFVMETDWAAGQVIEAIDRAGIGEETLVIFTADNGHSHYTGWEPLVAAGHQPSGPYRGHKGDIWEGGHRVPLILRWPGRIAAGAKNDQLVSLTDLFATCAELVGADLPQKGAEDSISFLASALGKDPKKKRTSLISHSNHGEFAFRRGDWKIVYRMPGRNLRESRGRPAEVELYNLREDVAEQNDLAEQKPQLVRSLTEELRATIDRGATRELPNAANDTEVRFETIQMKRWAPPRN